MRALLGMSELLAPFPELQVRESVSLQATSAPPSLCGPLASKVTRITQGTMDHGGEAIRKTTVNGYGRKKKVKAGKREARHLSR